MEAVGLVEVLGSSSAVVAADKMLKAADVAYETWHTRCGGHVTIFLSGSVSSVRAAVEAVQMDPPCEIVSSAVISGPSEETARIVNEIRPKKK